jgi:hypothetical protein
MYVYGVVRIGRYLSAAFLVYTELKGGELYPHCFLILVCLVCYASRKGLELTSYWHNVQC